MIDKILEWIMSMINLEGYTPLEFVLLVCGFTCWIALYIIVIKNAKKTLFVEIPFFVECADIAWEFIWGFIYNLDMGKAIIYGCRFWFFLDCVIFYFFWRYGRKHLLVEELKPYFKQMIVFWVLFWGLFVFFFAEQGYDNRLGVVSALIINVGISATYLFQLVRYPDKYISLLSMKNAWLKFIGTGAISVVCFIKWYDNHMLLTMCVAVFIMDIFYVIKLKEKQKKIPCEVL